MTERSRQVTCRKSQPFAAYLHLSHASGERSAKTTASHDGLLTTRLRRTPECVNTAYPAEQWIPTLEGLVHHLHPADSKQRKSNPNLRVGTGAVTALSSRGRAWQVRCQSGGARRRIRRAPCQQLLAGRYAYSGVSITVAGRAVMRPRTTSAVEARVHWQDRQHRLPA